MGWWGYQGKRKATLKQLDQERDKVRKVVSCYRGGLKEGTYWTVAETPDGHRFILCDLLRYESEYGLWMVKTMDEFAFPTSVTCPESYIRTLCPYSDWHKEMDINKHAWGWRRRVLEEDALRRYRRGGHARVRFSEMMQRGWQGRDCDWLSELGLGKRNDTLAKWRRDYSILGR